MLSYLLQDDLLAKSIYNIIHVGDHAQFSNSLVMSMGESPCLLSKPGPDCLPPYLLPDHDICNTLIVLHQGIY
jgi:hypothetical protein